MQAPILITGAARSGTSMVAGIIARCGATGGKVLGPTPHNKRGQYENLDIVGGLVKPYLRMQSLDPLGQRPLPDVNDLLPFDNLRPAIESVMRKQGYTNGPWFYKGAKMCLLWPIFDKAFPRAKWIIVRRKDDQIISSCMRTGFMRKRSTPDEWQEWVDVHKQRFAEMNENVWNVREVWPEKFFIGDFSEISEAINWLGLTWDSDKVVDFVAPSLWNGGK